MRRLRPRPDFTLHGANVNSWGVVSQYVATSLEKRAWEALAEAAWEERVSRSQLLEEVAIDYLRERFPTRHLPTREEARFEADDEKDAELRPGVRHFEHDESHWRSSERVARRTVRSEL